MLRFIALMAPIGDHPRARGVSVGKTTAMKPQFDGGSGATGLLDAASEVLGLARTVLGANSGSALATAIERAALRQPHLAITGQFKRGKTTLVNALIGRDVLPSAVTPLTSVVTLVRYGPQERAQASFEDGTVREIGLPDLADYVTEAGNPRNARAVANVSMEIPAPMLEEGLVLVDLPGTGSLNAHNTEVAHGFLSQADAALLVLSADPPLSAQEVDELTLLRGLVPEVICVVNKIDQVSPAERAAVLAFTRDQLAAAGQGGLPVVATSARDALRAREPDTGGNDTLLGDLEQLIAGRVRGRLDALGANTLRRRTLATLEDVMAALELELGALQLGDTERARRASRFEAIATDISRELDDGAVVARARAQRALQASVEPRIRALAAAAADAVDRSLATARSSESPDDGDLADRLRGLVTDEVSAWVQTVGEVLAEAVDPVLQEEVRQANALRAAALRDAAALFELGVPPAAASTSAVSVNTADLLRLDDQATGALELAAVAFRQHLPGSVGRRAKLRAARAQAAELLDRHAGRLRSACAQAVDDALRVVSRSQHQALEETLEVVRGALASAEVSARRSAEAQRARLARIELFSADAARLQGILADSADR